jgi:hypothetical protein
MYCASQLSENFLTCYHAVILREDVCSQMYCTRQLSEKFKICNYSIIMHSIIMQWVVGDRVYRNIHPQVCSEYSV